MNVDFNTKSINYIPHNKMNLQKDTYLCIETSDF
jgi:hypothetical protein